MDFYTNLTFKIQNGRGPKPRDPISKFLGPPYNFLTNRAIRFNFGIVIVWTIKVGVARVTSPNIEILGPPYN